MALPEIGHRTSIGRELYELVSIYKLQDGQVTLQFERVDGAPEGNGLPEIAARATALAAANPTAPKRAPKGTGS